MGYIISIVCAVLVAASSRWWGAETPIRNHKNVIAGAIVMLLGTVLTLGDPSWRIVDDVYLSIWVVVAVVDLQDRIIPNRLVLLTILWALLIGPWTFNHWLDALTTGGAIFLFYLVINVVSHGGMGMGDVKYSGALAISLAWPQAMVATVAGIWAAGIAGLILILLRKKSRKDTMALGPYLVFGGIIGLLGSLH